MSGSIAGGVECPREPNQARRLRTREPGTTVWLPASWMVFVSVMTGS